MKKQTKLLLAVLLVLVMVFVTACTPKECTEHNYVDGVCTVCGAKQPVAKRLMRIGITAQPAKTEYIVGEKFDATGMEVTAFYNDSTKEVVTDYTIDKTGELTREDKSVTVIYREKRATVRISVRAAFVVAEALTVETADNRIYTIEAESLDFGNCINSNDNSLAPNVEVPQQQHPLTSGGKCVSTLSVMGNKFGFAVTSKVAAKVTIVARASATHVNIAMDEMMNVTWNGETVRSGKTLNWTDGHWFDWDHAFYVDLDLNEGRNEMLFTVAGNNAPNFDCFYVIVAPTGEEELPETVGNITPPDPSKTTIAVDNADNHVYTIEAEELDYTDCVSMRGDGTTHTVEEPTQEHPLTSGGKSVGALSVAGNKFGFTVDSKVAAKATIVMRAAPTETDMELDKFVSVTWNGAVVTSGKTLVWNTDHAHWFDWDHAFYTELDLVQGTNTFVVTIVARDEQGSVNAPNFDCFYLIVSPTGEEDLPETVGQPQPPQPQHVCESKCEICQGCKNADCTEEVCKTKCTCKPEPQHVCESKCETCQGCKNADCTEDVCKTKCTCKPEPPTPTADLVLDNIDNHVYTIEAENLDYSKCTNSNDPNSTHNVESPAQGHPVTSGGKSVGALSVAGNTFGFTVYSDVAAKVTIVMRAAATHISFDVDKVMIAKWNDSVVTSGKTLVWNTDNAHWFDWDHAFFADLDLVAGVNKFEITVIARDEQGSVNFPNLDCFFVIVAPTGEEELLETVVHEEPIPECDIVLDGTAGKINTIEAESLDYSKCINSNNPNLTHNVEEPGQGFPATSGGKSVGSLSVAGNTFGFTVYSKSATKVTIVMRAAATHIDLKANDVMTVTWNDVTIQSNKLFKWKDGQWFDWDHAFFRDLEVKEGLNTFKIVVKEREPGSTNFFNLDAFYVIENEQGNEILPECMSTITVKTAGAGTYTVQAENLDYSGCSFNGGRTEVGFEDNTDGGKNAIGLSVAGNKISFVVNNLTGSDFVAKFVMRASANGAAMTLDNLLKITVNGVEIKTGATLPWDGAWNNCSTATADNVTFVAGRNEIVIEVLDGGCPNLDYFAIELA